MIYDYPMSKKLIKDLEKEYRLEEVDKGNTWRNETSMSYLMEKIKEEANEVDISFHNEYFHTDRKHTYQELLDLILVSCMLAERIR